jgi:hypothetical protein
MVLGGGGAPMEGLLSLLACPSVKVKRTTSHELIMKSKRKL